MRRVVRIAGTRDDQQVTPFRSRRSHEFVGRGVVVQCDHQGARGAQMQPPQQLDLRYIAEIHRRTVRSLARDAVGVTVDRDIRHLVDLQHRPDRLPDPSEPGDDHPWQCVGDLRHQDARVHRRVGRRAAARTGRPASIAAG